MRYRVNFQTLWLFLQLKLDFFFWKFGHPNRFLPLELIIGGDKTGCLLLLQSELSQAFIIIIQSLYVVASGVWPCCHTQPTCCLPKRFLSTGYPLSTSTYSSSVISPNVALTAAEQYSTEIGDFLTNFTTLTNKRNPVSILFENHAKLSHFDTIFVLSETYFEGLSSGEYKQRIIHDEEWWPLLYRNFPWNQHVITILGSWRFT